MYSSWLFERAPRSSTGRRKFSSLVILGIGSGDGSEVRERRGEVFILRVSGAQGVSDISVFTPSYFIDEWKST
jgi:hypothetical protein